MSATNYFSRTCTPKRSKHVTLRQSKPNNHDVTTVGCINWTAYTLRCEHNRVKNNHAEKLDNPYKGKKIDFYDLATFIEKSKHKSLMGYREIFKGDGMCLGDIFPCGFNKEAHKEKKHGASCEETDELLGWGYEWRKGEEHYNKFTVFKLFALTKNNDLYYSNSMKPAYNTCANIPKLINDESKSGNNPTHWVKNMFGYDSLVRAEYPNSSEYNRTTYYFEGRRNTSYGHIRKGY